jgi:hypothetical protein
MAISESKTSLKSKFTLLGKHPQRSIAVKIGKKGKRRCIREVYFKCDWEKASGRSIAQAGTDEKA